MSTAERAAFLEATLAAQARAERALHEGDVAPRLSMWSHDDPVTLFGAGTTYRSGWPEVCATFKWVATTFTTCDEYDFEVLAADACGDLAYIVGIERYRAVKSGAVVDHRLRATHIYRRGTDGWKIVHRHGDHMPDDASAQPPEQSER